MVSDATAKVGDTVSDLAAKTEKVVQDKIDQGKPVLRDLQASAGAAIDKAAGLARDASSAGVQAVAQAGDAMRGRQQGGSGRHHCVSAGRPRRRVCEPICRRTAADRSAHRRRYRIWARLSDTPELKIYASLRSRASLNSKAAGPGQRPGCF